MANQPQRNIVICVCLFSLVACATPDTQTGKSAKTGATYGALAGLVFGGDLGDVVEGAIVGGAGGAVYGSVKANEQQKAKSNEIASRESQQRMRIEQERLALEKSIANSQASMTSASNVKKSWTQDTALLERAFGKDSVDGLVALRDCDHSRAIIYATAAENGSMVTHQLAGTWLKAMIAVDSRDQPAADTAFQRLVRDDPDVSSVRQASDYANETLTDVRSDRRELGISCS